MPRYDFRDTNTGEVFERTMRIADKEQYLRDNPHIEHYHQAFPGLGDPVRLGIRRIDGGFKEVLSRISEKTPGGKTLRSNSSQDF